MGFCNGKETEISSHTTRKHGIFSQEARVKDWRQWAEHYLRFREILSNLLGRTLVKQHQGETAWRWWR